jgi:hypothetical protein
MDVGGWRRRRYCLERDVGIEVEQRRDRDVGREELDDELRIRRVGFRLCG